MPPLASQVRAEPHPIDLTVTDLNLLMFLTLVVVQFGSVDLARKRVASHSL